MKREGRKLAIDFKKLDMFFKIVIEYESKKYIARKLGIRSLMTFNKYLDLGSEYIDKFENLLNEHDFFDIDLSEFEDEWSGLLEFKETEFKQKYKIESIFPKYSDRFFDWYEKERTLFLEKILFQKEKNILKEITFDEKDEQVNEDIKLLILFNRIYERADMASFANDKDIFDKAKVDPKNIKYVENRLKKKDKDEFQEDPLPKQEVQHNISFTLIEEALRLESQLSQNKNLLTDNVIDADYEIKE